MSPITRRTFVHAAGVGALVSSAGSSALARAFASVAVSTSMRQLNYEQVRLLRGPLLEQFEHQTNLYLSLDNDRLLKPFRQLTGQAAPGEDMGGWYTPSKDFDPPKNMTGYIPGHSFGQYLSALSRSYAVTGDHRTQQKVHSLIADFAPTALPKFYDGYCLPCYTYEKTLGGLIDAHRFARDPQALRVLNRATDAVMPYLPDHALTRSEMKARPHSNVAFEWDEPYTLPENLYLAYQRGAGERYRTMARQFLQDKTYFTLLAEGENVLPGEHAYSHVNALCSAMQAYLVDGSEMHLRAAKNGFDFVLQQSFATGGWGPGETFRKPGTDALAESLEKQHSSFETPCGAYGHFKIARYLLRVSGDSRYGDSMETMLYNTILGARPTQQDGNTFYYADYTNNARKAWYEQKWPCCSGTFAQLTADYGISTYLGVPGGIAVNLYVPSRVSFRQGSASISVTQQTSYPHDSETTLLVETDRTVRFPLWLRIPAWAGKGTRASINGKAQSGDLRAGSWLQLERAWQNGDRVELSLDMPLRLVPLDAQHASTVALAHGPLVLFAVLPAPGKLTRQQLLRAVRSSSGSHEWQVSAGTGSVQFLPFADIDQQHYRLYHSV